MTTIKGFSIGSDKKISDNFLPFAKSAAVKAFPGVDSSVPKAPVSEPAPTPAAPKEGVIAKVVAAVTGKKVKK
jgi:hypothetical protein